MTPCPFCPITVADLQGHLALCGEAPAAVRLVALAAETLAQDGADLERRALLAFHLGEAIAEVLWAAHGDLSAAKFAARFEDLWLLGVPRLHKALELLCGVVWATAQRRWHELRRPRA